MSNTHTYIGELLLVHLVDGTNSSNGRVKVYYNGIWGTVCDDYWDIRDGDVVCRQLGFAAALSVHPYAHFGQEEGKRVWMNIVCRIILNII